MLSVVIYKPHMCNELQLDIMEQLVHMCSKFFASLGVAKKKNLSIEQGASIVTLSKVNYSGQAIIRKLKISLGAVQGILKKNKENGSVIDKPRSGRPLSTSSREDRELTQLSHNNRTATTP